MKVLTQEQSEFYKEQGYIILENFINPTDLKTMLGELDRLVAEKARNLAKDEGGFNLEKVQNGPEINSMSGDAVGVGILRKIQEITSYSPLFRDFIHGNKMLDLVEDLIGDTIYYHSSKLMFKPAKHGAAKPWHQDYAYWASTKPDQVTTWIALDDATPENGCMQLIPGSHKWGLVKHKGKELQLSMQDIPAEKIKIAPMKAGSILCFHVLTMHYSAANTSDKGRRALIADYDPNPRRSKLGFSEDTLLRLNGRTPTAEEVAANRGEVLAQA